MSNKNKCPFPLFDALEYIKKQTHPNRLSSTITREV
jgi:hypothetical protein